MPVETKIENGAAFVTLTGRLTLGKDVERLEKAVDDLIAENQKMFIFDASALDYADSAGIGTVVACLTHIKKAGGEMRLAGANARVRRLFQMTGVDKLLALYPTVAEARA